MGLTINFSLRTRLRGVKQIRAVLDQLRHRAFDLPFQVVGPLVTCVDQECHFESRQEDDPHRQMLKGCRQYIEREWPDYGIAMHEFEPHQAIGFCTIPGDGCEGASFGLCHYPATISVRDPRQPSRFQTIRTRLAGWRWSSFCKTVFASNPEFGGVENFLRCHLSLVGLLDAARELGLLEWVKDESDYWDNRDLGLLAWQVGGVEQMQPGWEERLVDRLGRSLIRPLAPAGGNPPSHPMEVHA